MDRNEELQIIFDSVPGLIFFKDCDNRFLRVNRYFSDVMGMTPESMANRRLKICFRSRQKDIAKTIRKSYAPGIL